MPIGTLTAIGLGIGALSSGAGLLSALRQRGKTYESQFDSANYTGLNKLADISAGFKAFSPQLSRMNQFNAANLNRLAAGTRGSSSAATMQARGVQRDTYDSAFANYMPAAMDTAMRANSVLADLRYKYDTNAQNLTAQNYQQGQAGVMSGLNSFANLGFSLAAPGIAQMMDNGLGSDFGKINSQAVRNQAYDARMRARDALNVQPTMPAPRPLNTPSYVPTPGEQSLNYTYNLGVY